MWPSGDSSPSRQAAVVDIGSNSVRLVVYRVEGRAIWTSFNEKALAGLGRDLPATGKLSPQGVETALAALRRYRMVLQGWPEAEVFTVATAAVRDARDGRAFLQRAEQELGFAVRLLSGEEEARFGALGVLAGQPDAEGIAGDMGGSSLELVRLEDGGPGDGVTLPLGPFSLGAPKPLDAGQVRKKVEAKLKPVAARFAARRLHAVGGAWRNLALLHMAMTDYPLHVTHQYCMTAAEALEAARFAARQSKTSLERTEGLSRKRFDTLPYAALVLEALIERLGLEQVVISAYGLREGLLLDSMTAEDRAQDPLIAGCEALASTRGLAAGLGQALEAWLTPAFGTLEPMFGAHDSRLIAAACRMADVGGRLHPDHRADLVFEEVLRMPVAGIDHAERAFLACAMFARHTAASTPPEPQIIGRVLSPERRQRARALGSAIRLGCDLSGRNPRLLELSSLRMGFERLVIKAEPGASAMLLGEQTAKRATTLAGVLGLRLELG